MLIFAGAENWSCTLLFKDFLLGCSSETPCMRRTKLVKQQLRALLVPPKRDVAGLPLATLCRYPFIPVRGAPGLQPWTSDLKVYEHHNVFANKQKKILEMCFSWTRSRRPWPHITTCQKSIAICIGMRSISLRYISILRTAVAHGR